MTRLKYHANLFLNIIAILYLNLFQTDLVDLVPINAKHIFYSNLPENVAREYAAVRLI